MNIRNIVTEIHNMGQDDLNTVIEAVKYARAQAHRNMARALIVGDMVEFAGRGGLTDAYNFAMRDLNAAISSLSEAQRKKIFNEGKCFMNLEVIWPESVNVIPFSITILIE